MNIYLGGPKLRKLKYAYFKGIKASMKLTWNLFEILYIQHLNTFKNNGKIKKGGNRITFFKNDFETCTYLLFLS